MVSTFLNFFLAHISCKLVACFVAGCFYIKLCSIKQSVSSKNRCKTSEFRVRVTAFPHPFQLQVRKDLGLCGSLCGLLFVYKGSPFLLPCFLFYLHLQLHDLGLVVWWLVTVFWVQCFCGHPAGLDHLLLDLGHSVPLLHYCTGVSAALFERRAPCLPCAAVCALSPLQVRPRLRSALEQTVVERAWDTVSFQKESMCFSASRVLRYGAFDPGVQPQVHKPLLRPRHSGYEH